MSLRLFNTLGREKQVFESIEPRVVRMYNCGPTVYNRQHIGNFRAFLFADLLRRWLEISGYEVRQVMNITDVGHLVDDADEGEDKIEARARREGLDPWQISRENTETFRDDLRRLGVQPAHLYPKATEHIPEMLEIVRGLIEKGFAYRTGGNVYFEVGRFDGYGKLSGNRIEDLEAGARLEVNDEKRHPADFALWKADPHHIMKWESEYGPDGFPGWHIECSAMARRHLGDSIDIHTGGEDNIFPHHECEIAQSESFTGAPFARYWLHTKFLQVEGGKMAKSLGNVFTLDDVEERGFSIRALRYLLLSGHYGRPLNFTWEGLRGAASALENLDEIALRLARASGAAGEPLGAAAEPEAGLDRVASARAAFVEAMDDDLDVPNALPALFGLRPAVLEGRLGREAAARGLELMREADRALGVIEFQEGGDERVEGLIAARNRARDERDWAEADRIRDELLAEGVVLEDGAAGTTWRRR